MQHVTSVVIAVALAGTLVHPEARQGTPGAPDLRWFFEATSQDEDVAEEAMERIAGVWRDGYASMIVDLARLMRSAAPPSDGPISATLPADQDSGQVFSGGEDMFATGRRPDPSTIVRRRLTRFLEDQTGQNFGDDLSRWREWIWAAPYEPHPDYAEYKGHVFAQIDRDMQQFFPPDVPAAIRLDEIEWGGVTPNGIPPLEYPDRIPAQEARYLRDDHVVFGLYVNGEARAYPKRIIAWHELVHDRVGDVELTIVYCTLCGTVIPYESVAEGEHHRLGTSGLLYRSNKLMFDEGTLSLWSTFEGKPVVGPLVGSGVRLRALPVVTTTWKEWRERHPDTAVLSLDTGFDRDYDEGAAYRSYFSTDRLMFPVPSTDDRLKNKEEVLVMRLQADGGSESVPVAIEARFLARNRVYQAELAGVPLVILTTRDGANRVYRGGDVRFDDEPEAGRIRDTSGASWLVTEEALVLEADPSTRLPREPAQRAFWFGWYAQFPETELIQ